MDNESAYRILGLAPGATLSDVEASFRRAASDAHPDRGGTNERMGELIAARDLLFQTVSRETALIPLSAVHDLVLIAARESGNKAANENQAKDASAQIARDSTNRLRANRRLAAIAAAVSAASMFMIKELPLEKYSAIQNQEIEQLIEDAKQKSNAIRAPAPPPVPASSATPIDPKYAKEYEAGMRKLEEAKDRVDYFVSLATRTKAQQAQLELMLKMLALSIAAAAGGGAWLLTRRIADVESNIAELDETVASRSRLFRLLREIYSGKLPSSWSIDDLEAALDYWSTGTKGRIQAIARTVGPSSFAMYLMKHAKASELVELRTSLADHEFSETYSISRKFTT